MIWRRCPAYRIEEAAKDLLMEDEGERTEHGLQERGNKEGHLLPPYLGRPHTLHSCVCFRLLSILGQSGDTSAHCVCPKGTEVIGRLGRLGPAL